MNESFLIRGNLNAGYKTNKIKVNFEKNSC